MSYEHKVQEFYDDAIHAYQKIMGDYWHHADPDALAVGLPRPRGCEILEEKLVGLAAIKPGDRVLDFGSGIGGPTLHMSKFSGAKFIGVTNNQGLTNMALQNAEKRGLTGQVTFQKLDDTGYQHMPFEDASFDAVTFYESVCHLTDKAALFREIFRVLKPGGRLVGMDWLQRAFGENQTEEQIMKYMGPINDAIRIPWHGTVENYRKMMEDAGLKVFIARDLYEGKHCWSVVQDDETPDWFEYGGPEAQMFVAGEKALAAARRAGVFTVGMWAAQKPA